MAVAHSPNGRSEDPASAPPRGSGAAAPKPRTQSPGPGEGGDSPGGRRRARTSVCTEVLRQVSGSGTVPCRQGTNGRCNSGETQIDRKSTRLNSSHLGISYAV